MFHVKHSAFPRANSLCAVVIGERTKPPRMCARIKDFFGIAICHPFDNAHLPSNALEGPYKGSVRQPPPRALETNLGNWDFFRNPRTFRVTLCVYLLQAGKRLAEKGKTMSRPSVELYKRDHPDSAKVVEYADGDPYQFGYHRGVADAGAGFAPLGPLDEDSFFLVGPTLAGYRDGYGDYQAELRYARGIRAEG